MELEKCWRAIADHSLKKYFDTSEAILINAVLSWPIEGTKMVSASLEEQDFPCCSKI